MATGSTLSSVPPWIMGLRMQLRTALGPGWSVSPMRDKAKLFARFQNGERKSLVLPCLWLPASSSEILRTAETMHQLLQSGLSFDSAKAHVLGHSSGTLPGAASPTSPDFADLWEHFGNFKVKATGQVKLSTWQKDYLITGERLREDKPSQPESAKALLRAIGERWPPGSRRREIVVQHVAALCGGQWKRVSSRRNDGHLLHGSGRSWDPRPRSKRPFR